MDLKIKDVAELLHVSESTIRRWLTEGKIPAYRLNQQYRFSRNEVEDWVMDQKRGANPATHFGDFHIKESTNLPQTGNKQFSLYRAIHKGNVLAGVAGKTKAEVIRSTMRIMSQDLGLDADVLTELLLDRENLQPTALNNGVGIPHTRDFLLSSHHDVVTIVFPENPLEYGALDGKPVHSLFFLFACDDKKHLHLLAKIAHLSSQPAALNLLRNNPSKEAVLAYVKEWEGNAS